MTQYYIVEIQQYQNGEFGHIVHYAYDEDPNEARLKGESKYYEVLAAAAISDLPTHSAILFASNAFPVMHQSYTHTAVTQETPDNTEETPNETEG